MDIYIIKILSYSYTGKIKLITSILIEGLFQFVGIRGFLLPDPGLFWNDYGTIRRVTNPVHICLDEARDGYRQGMPVARIEHRRSLDY